MTKNAKICLASAVFSVVAAIVPATAHATSEPVLVPVAGFVEDTGAADRIAAGEKIRTLTQALASAACHMKAGIDVGASEKILKAGTTKFDRLLTALEKGDADLNIIGAETRGSLLRDLKTVRDQWSVAAPSYAAILSNPSDDAALDTIYATSEELLAASNKLLANLEGAYSNPTELLQSDMLLIEVSGKQAMAAQRISLEACRIWSGVGTEKDVEELQMLTEQFAFAVKALRNGEPMLGLAAAPTDEIAQKLDEAIADWDQVSWKLDALATSGSITQEEAEVMCRTLFKKMATMEKVSHLYLEYSRRVY